MSKPMAVNPTIPYFAEEWLRLFDYDRAAPLSVREVGIEDRDGVAVHDITFAGPLRPRIPAYLVAPAGAGPFGAILFAHWFEPPAPTSSRAQFVDEAVALARSGAVSLLIDGLFPWRGSPSANEAAYDRRLVAHNVIELRRALDVLLSRADVDPQRIGFVGHDFHAMHGTLLAGIESRTKAYVLMAGTPRYADWFLKYWPSYLDDEQREAYLREMAAVDPINYAGRAAPASLFFQFARDDRFIPPEAAQAYYAAASEPKRIEWYDAKHYLDEAAQRDRAAWLSEQLGL
ncbi:MAG TPA: hypothetical protein VJG32_12430 [Anaerolineae bacterium]|nr:hypothetical protein [Anaerolineae bacterium]